MKISFFVYTLLMLVFLTSCAGSSTGPTPTPVDIGAIQTAAVETVVAPLTQTAAAFTPPPIDTEIPTLTPEPSQSPTPSGSPTPNICNKMEFVSDSSVPDGTTMTAGQEFVKTWKVKNTGPCAWTTAYTIVYGYGDSKLGGQTTALTARVEPNTEAEISITLKAPVTPNTYHSYWRLADNNGYPFGTVLTVVIIVQ